MDNKDGIEKFEDSTEQPDNTGFMIDRFVTGGNLMEMIDDETKNAIDAVVTE